MYLYRHFNETHMDTRIIGWSVPAVSSEYFIMNEYKSDGLDDIFHTRLRYYIT